MRILEVDQKVLGVDLYLKYIFSCMVPPQNFVCHQGSIVLEDELLTVVSREDVELVGGAILEGVLICDGQLQDACANWLIFLGTDRQTLLELRHGYALEDNKQQ